VGKKVVGAMYLSGTHMNFVMPLFETAAKMSQFITVVHSQNIQ